MILRDRQVICYLYVLDEEYGGPMMRRRRPTGQEVIKWELLNLDTTEAPHL